MLNLNLNAAGTFSVCGGYPFRLLPAGDYVASGVIDKTVSSVSAIVQTEAGSANVHLGLFTMPATSTDGDNASLVQTDAVVTGTPQTVTVTVPTAAPACYVVRLWVDSITGATADTISRDGSTAASLEPLIPVAVSVSSVTVS